MTTRFGRTSARLALVVVAAGSLVVSACSADDEPMTSTPDSVVSVSTEVTTGSTEPTATELPADVTPSGVILAATLIATGNIDDAVASGLVTPAEVDEARAAIENDTLDRWVALAEGD